MAILIHGDAAVAGQGIVYEVVQMSGLPDTPQVERFTLSSTTRLDSPQTTMMRAPVFIVQIVAKIVDAPVLAREWR